MEYLEQLDVLQAENSVDVRTLLKTRFLFKKSFHFAMLLQNYIYTESHEAVGP